MKKSILAAAAFAALAIGTAGGASAGVIGSNVGGVKAGTPTELAQVVHYKKKHWGHKRWHKHRKVKKCVWRHGHRHCYWR